MIFQEMRIAIDENTMKGQLCELEGFAFQSALVSLDREQAAPDDAKKKQEGRCGDDYFKKAQTLALSPRECINRRRKRQLREDREGDDADEE